MSKFLDMIFDPPTPPTPPTDPTTQREADPLEQIRKEIVERGICPACHANLKNPNALIQEVHQIVDKMGERYITKCNKCGYVIEAHDLIAGGRPISLISSAGPF